LGDGRDDPLAEVTSPHLDAGLSRAQLFAYARDLRGALAATRRTAEELERTHLQTVAALAAAVDARDAITGGHVHRVANYGAILAAHLAPELRDDPQLVYGFLLHDIGKIATPDAILNKPGPLDDEERAVMRRHVPDGVRFVASVGFLRPALDIIATHHEHVDGSGYPRGLRGEEIPIGARMFIVCDAFDALTHDRPYRGAVSPDEALSELHRCRGRQFDGDVVDAFERCLPDLLAVPDRPELPAVRRRTSTPAPAIDPGLHTAVFDAIDRAIVVLSPGGAVQEANERFLRLLGLRHAPIGVPISDVVARADGLLVDVEAAAAVLRPLEQDLLEGQRSGTLRARDGRGLPWRSQLLRDRHGVVLGRVLVIDTGAPADPAAPDAS
jgi:putative nucleotidyltransferase with HDIG domain